MSEFIGFIKSIPPEIWGPFLGAALTLTGVLITNWHNTKRLEMQLAHDGETKSKERKYSMRREVYLNAAEELVKANSYLGSLAQFDFQKNNFGDGLNGFFSASAKLGLIAEKETSEALNELSMAYSELIFKLLERVAPILELRGEEAAVGQIYEDYQVKVKHILNEMELFNKSGNENDELFKRLNQMFEFNNKNSNEYAERHQELLSAIAEETKEFSILVFSEMKKINELQIPVFVGMRKELDIDTDVDAYEAQVKNGYKALEEQMSGFVTNAEARAKSGARE